MKNNILVIGGGSIGRRHLTNLNLLKYKNLFCLKRVYNSKFEKEYNCIVITASEDIKTYDINILIVCTPTSLHIKSIEFGIKNNCHIFMEKPLTHDLSTYLKIKKLLKNHKKVFFIGFMLRYHPFIKKIKDTLKTEELGSVYSSAFEFGSFLPSWHPYEDYKLSYASKKSLGGGVINTITHELDLIQYLFGLPDYIFCETMNSNILSIEVEEQCKAIFSFESHLCSLHLDYIQKEKIRCIKILSEYGKIEWNWNKNVLVIKNYKTKKEKRTKSEFEINDLYITELKDFFNLINKNILIHPLDENHALENTKLALLMHESSKSRRQVTYDHI